MGNGVEPRLSHSGIVGFLAVGQAPSEAKKVRWSVSEGAVFTTSVRGVKAIVPIVARRFNRTLEPYCGESGRGAGRYRLKQPVAHLLAMPARLGADAAVLVHVRVALALVAAGAADGGTGG